MDLRFAFMTVSQPLTTPAARVAGVVALLIPLTATLCAVAAPTAHAEDVVLSEVIPSLAGTQFGSAVIGEAPATGKEKRFSRKEISRALKVQGIDASIFRLPKSVKISRKPRWIERAELEQLVRTDVEAHMAPCTVTQLELPDKIKIGPGDATVDVKAHKPQRTGRASASVRLITKKGEAKFSAMAHVTCPDAAVAPGDRVTIQVKLGNVKATAPGVINQRGRVGDTVRVRNLVTQASLMAKVVDAGTVEVKR